MPAERVRVDIEGRSVSLTHLDRVLYASGFTKAEVIDYYTAVAGVVLPHLAGRALTMIRYPNGVSAGGFYAKNAPGGTPSWVRRVRMPVSEGELDHVVVDSLATLVWLANLSAIELHIPLWLLPTEDREPDDPGEQPLCDRLVLDLDPGSGAGIPECATLALALRAALADDGLDAVPKTSGATGMHLMVPIRPSPTDAVVGYVRQLAEALAAAAPELATAKLGERERAEIGRAHV